MESASRKSASAPDLVIHFRFHCRTLIKKEGQLAPSEAFCAGIVCRARDANNYYVVRANALEDNVVLYKTVKGIRSAHE